MLIRMDAKGVLLLHHLLNDISMELYLPADEKKVAFT